MKINLKMHYTQISLIWIKEERNKLSRTKRSCRDVELLNTVVTIKYSTEDTAYSIEDD